MNELRLIYDYKNNDQYRLSFNRLINQSFNLNMEPWYRYGFWDDKYVCYSYAAGDEIVSNISACKMELIINHEMKTAVQLCAVTTHSDYRKRGLAKDLMIFVLEKYEKEVDFIFLCGNKTVIDFYPKFGFKPIIESKYEMSINICEPSEASIRKLDATDMEDIDFVSHFASLRWPISAIVGVENFRNYLMFGFQTSFSDCFYYLEEDDVLIVFRQIDKILHIYDIVGKKPIHLENLIGKIAGKGVERIVFYFTPDLLDMEVKRSPLLPDDPIFHDMFFIRPASFIFGEYFKFPVTAQL
jgi:ribosomal protein S18 acetylase RimI-like enzyme